MWKFAEDTLSPHDLNYWSRAAGFPGVDLPGSWGAGGAVCLSRPLLMQKWPCACECRSLPATILVIATPGPECWGFIAWIPSMLLWLYPVRLQFPSVFGCLSKAPWCSIFTENQWGLAIKCFHLSLLKMSPINNKTKAKTVWAKGLQAGFIHRTSTKKSEGA